MLGLSLYTSLPILLHSAQAIHLVTGVSYVVRDKNPPNCPLPLSPTMFELFRRKFFRRLKCVVWVNQERGSQSRTLDLLNIWESWGLRSTKRLFSPEVDMFISGALWIKPTSSGNIRNYIEHFEEVSEIAQWMFWWHLVVCYIHCRQQFGQK